MSYDMEWWSGVSFVALTGLAAVLKIFLGDLA